MAKYTTQVRTICENKSGLVESKGYNDIETIITAAAPQIFNFSFPIFDETYRLVLEKKILRHYYMREIGEETVGLWQLRLNTRLNEIMPYYNKLYSSELLTFNPLQDTDYTKSGDRSGESNEGKSEEGENRTTTTMTGTVRDVGEGSNTQHETGTDNDVRKNDHWDYYSDTPQGTVSNLANLTYLTNARHITDDGAGSTRTKNLTTTNETETDTTRTYNTTNVTAGTNSLEGTKQASTTEEYAERVLGKMPGKSYSKLLQEFRDTFLNIDLMVINDLSDLFFGLWE